MQVEQANEVCYAISENSIGLLCQFLSCSISQSDFLNGTQYDEIQTQTQTHWAEPKQSRICHKNEWLDQSRMNGNNNSEQHN